MDKTAPPTEAGQIIVSPGHQLRGYRQIKHEDSRLDHALRLF